MVLLVTRTKFGSYHTLAATILSRRVVKKLRIKIIK